MDRRDTFQERSGGEYAPILYLVVVKIGRSALQGESERHRLTRHSGLPVVRACDSNTAHVAFLKNQIRSSAHEDSRR